MMSAIAKLPNEMFRWSFSAIVGFFARRCPKHRLSVTYADGRRRDFYDGDGEPDVHIVFKSARAERRAVLQFYQGLIEGYIDEQVDLLGDQAFRKLVEIADVILENPAGRRGRLAVLFGKNPIVWTKQVLQEVRQDNRSPATAKRNAIAHYGHASEFYEYLLGDTVGYSEGYWPVGTETLNQAKHNLYDYVARKLCIKPGHRVVEVGSGWGYLPILMARDYGADVTVYNPIPRQNDYMRQRFERHGLASAIRIVEKDHRDLREEPNTYDRYVSIGVYEHAGKGNYRDWLDSIAATLKPNGLGMISTTAKMRREMTDYLTLKYIFPGGNVPSLPHTLAAMRERGLTLLDVENLWPHYERTARCWLDRLESEWPDIQKIDPTFFTERFRRIWTMYLSGISNTFRANLELMHIVFMKGRGEGTYPWSRDYMYQGWCVKSEAEIDFSR
jgi:cyclopropane-fatty-acyl-phospholipid synthase